MNSNDYLKNFAQKAKRRLVGREQVKTKIKVISNEDVDFKNRAIELLSQEKLVSNPVHFLMDEKILKNMSEEEKERYLLSTLDKFSALRRELEHSNASERFCM